jgi:hypothetical protein
VRASHSDHRSKPNSPSTCDSFADSDSPAGNDIASATSIDGRVSDADGDTLEPPLLLKAPDEAAMELCDGGVGTAGTEVTGTDLTVRALEPGCTREVGVGIGG